jgi:hypothetical protein
VRCPPHRICNLWKRAKLLRARQQESWVMVQLGLLVRPVMREILRPAKKNAGSQDIAEQALEVGLNCATGLIYGHFTDKAHISCVPEFRVSTGKLSGLTLKAGLSTPANPFIVVTSSTERSASRMRNIFGSFPPTE